MDTNNSQATISWGFTLLEVMVALSILATLLTVIIQSQSETILFLEKTTRLEKARREVTRRLLVIERGGKASGEGTFSDDHPLAGEHWKITKKRKLINIPRLKELANLLPSLEEIKYEVILGSGDEKQSFSDVLLRPSINQSFGQ